MKLRVLTREETGSLFAALALILGGWLRLYTPGLAGFPLNDGGLFLAMMNALQKNGFALPVSFEFNGLSLPFAYPPLGFYLGAWLSQTLGIDPVSVLQWLPAVVLILVIPAFYWLAVSLLGSKFSAGIAAFIYTFTPRAGNWALMGGGLTRSFGLLFLLLALASVHRLLKSQDKKYIFPAVLFSALAILSHPESALHAASFSLVLFLFYGRNRNGLLNSLTVALGVLAATSIWWLPAILRFGFAPYLAASQTGFHSIFSLILPLFLPLTDEPHMTLAAVLGITGFAYSLAKKNYLLPALYLMPYLAEPRSAPVQSAIFLAMLAGVSMVEIVLPVLAPPSARSARAEFLTLTFIGVCLFGNAASFNLQFAGTAVSPSNRSAFAWVKENTPAQSRVLVLTGESDIFCDGISEWFPALTERISPSTVQGREWLPGFDAALNAQRSLQACLNVNNPLQCVEDTTKEHSLPYDYLYIARQSAFKQFCRVAAPLLRGDTLIAELSSRSEYRLVYQTHAVAIFAQERAAP